MKEFIVFTNTWEVFRSSVLPAEVRESGVGAGARVGSIQAEVFIDDAWFIHAYFCLLSSLESWIEVLI